MSSATGDDEGAALFWPELVGLKTAQDAIDMITPQMIKPIVRSFVDVTVFTG